MALYTNRLNLLYMVDSQLKDKPQHTDVYFTPQTIGRHHIQRSSDGKHIARRKTAGARKTNIDTSVKSIYATVHNQLYAHSVTKPVAPAIPQAIAETMKPTNTIAVNNNIQATGGEGSRSMSHISHTTMSRFPNSAKSIPQIKVDLERKGQQRLHHGIANTPEMRDYERKQRVKEIIRQKQELDVILKEHQELRRNRHSVAMEIQGMKSYLCQIQQKLDQSLKKLDANKTICGSQTTAKRPSNVSNSGKNKNKPNTTAVVSGKPIGQHNKNTSKGGMSIPKTEASPASASKQKRRNLQRRVSLDRRLIEI